MEVEMDVLISLYIYNLHYYEWTPEKSKLYQRGCLVDFHVLCMYVLSVENKSNGVVRPIVFARSCRDSRVGCVALRPRI